MNDRLSQLTNCVQQTLYILRLGHAVVAGLDQLDFDIHAL